MSDYEQDLMNAYYRNERSIADNKKRKSISEDMLEANPTMYDENWEDSEENRSLIKEHDRNLRNDYRNLWEESTDRTDIASYDMDGIIGKKFGKIDPVCMIQVTESEEKEWKVSNKPKNQKKKKKKEKLIDTGKQMDRHKKISNDNHNASVCITNEGLLRRSEKREVDIDSAVKTLKEHYSFLCVAGRKLYAFTGKYYEDITDKNNAADVFKEFLSEDTNRLIRDYTEIHNQLLSDRDIRYSSIDEIRRNRNVIVFENGTYDLIEERFYENKFWENDRVFSIIRFEYHPEDMTGREFVEGFINTFCNGDWKRIKLFKQIVGYCLSNYENKKNFFYFVGVPNSGKSTVCRFLETAVGSEAYISVAVKQLNSRFVSGELEGVKVCADEDVAIKTPLKSEDVSMIKKITSSDKIRTDTKYQKPGQLHPECKLVLAGNGMLTFETSEDLQPLMERMIIFPLDREIPEDQRDPNIVDKLIAGRNYIISEALKALHDLVADNFRFTKVVQTETYFSAKNFSSGIEDFVEECCQLDEDSRENTAILHTVYMRFCSNHPEYKPKSINQFSSYLEGKYGLQPFNNGTNRGKIGIRLLEPLTH